MDQTNDNAALIKAAEDFLAAAKKFKGDPIARMSLMNKADNLRLHSEDAMGTMYRQCNHYHLTSALDILTSQGILQQIPTEGSAGSKELAEAVNLDESVIQRAMRVICAHGIAEESTPDVYCHNAKSLAYITGTSQYFFQMIVDQDFAFRKLPEYFKTHQKSDLLDRKKSPYAFAQGMEGKTFYEVISADRKRLEMFNETMSEMIDQQPVLGMFPFSSLKSQVEAEPDRAFMVDVGGGVGRALMSVLDEAPGGFGAPVILQDRPDVIDSIPTNSMPGLTKMAHDMFTPQPVKNAHTYFLRRVLHNYYEEVCIDIVKNIASAMGPTSRLLIGDFVVPDKVNMGDDCFVHWMNLTLMMISGKEKTKKQFEVILDAAGLQLVKIWPFPGDPQSVVEARLKR